MNLLAIIVILLAIATAGAIVYIAWEMSSDEPDVEEAEADAPKKPKNTLAP